MTGIDSVAAALLASRLDSLLTGAVSSAAGGGATAQVGTPGAGASPSPAAPAPGGAPPASTQTALSEVGRVLDAISRAGGDATPAVVGRAPLLADPAVLLADPADPAASADASAAPGAPGAPASAAAAARDATPPPPATALRAALAQAVSESGLFYESHLAQWLAGQRPLAALLREPQARLAAAQAGDADAAPPDALDELLAQRPSLPAARAAAQPGVSASGPSTPGGASPYAPAQEPAVAARPHAAWPPGAADLPGDSPELRWTPARAELAAASSDAPAQTPSPVHPAAVPLVRQQLDALATDQFRWTGDAWPGARLDWTIEPDDPGGRAPRGGDDAGDGIAWRTRLTLTLPSLGTVDAELVLNGAQLVARLRASHAGAERLTQHEAALRRRFEGSGLQLGGLSIRAVDHAPDAFDLFAAQAAATAYARGAADGAGPRTPDDDEAPR
ncbi:ribonuclease E [Burkholderia pseudomultivorans]|uniref:flagellar hook-length control protein FliK n=2 Tax=Burkholderia pseudomultivorans TaxID=1207504 RepID=UPI00075E7EAE|nr:flagellar hook-length control protein FliK [Burkholderia pseudomultivorans]KWI57334.1 ribonuclease E [Burkholderia pseudomultivorans]